MPIIKSAIKRTRQQAKRRSHNLQVKRAIHTDVRALQDAIAKDDAKLVSEAFRAAQSEIDRAVKKGTLHKNTAARQKSQLNYQAAPLLAKAPATKKSEAKTATVKPKTAAATVKKVAAKKTPTKKSTAAKTSAK